MVAVGLGGCASDELGAAVEQSEGGTQESGEFVPDEYCFVDADCESSTPMCVDGACEACSERGDDWCAQLDPAAAVCGANDACVPCGSQASCPDSVPLCTDEGRCVECTSEDVTVCDDANPLCNDQGQCSNACSDGSGIWEGVRRYYEPDYGEEIVENITMQLRPATVESECANWQLASSDGFCGRFSEDGLYLRRGGGHELQQWEGETDPALGCTTVTGSYSAYSFFADMELAYVGPLPESE
ncbi:MAG: hypothetical protein K0V04_08530 [Deltaproteobacteria bacterium]|nr:hypothetical protein [Deltaproteobacteria bacterium]